jgi:hypothetical protein
MILEAISKLEVSPKHFLATLVLDQTRLSRPDDGSEQSKSRCFKFLKKKISFNIIPIDTFKNFGSKLKFD